MTKDKNERILERLKEEAYRSSYSGEGLVPRFAIRYKQGSRTLYTTAFSALELDRLAVIKSITKDDPEPEKKWNRPFIAKHATAIENYLTQSQTKKDYILPSITLDAYEPLKFQNLSEGESEDIDIGYLLIPITYRFYVTDGQHRIKALSSALSKNEDLKKDKYAVMIVEENDLEKVHQDFADCAKVKPIKSSQITTFETREPVRLFTKEVCKRVPLFKKRVERISDTIGKTSSKLYTINHVKIACEELLIGITVGRDDKKREQCEKLLANGQDSNWLDKVVRFFKIFSEANPQWKRALALDSSIDLNTSILKEMKNDYIIFNGTALQVIGRVGHLILKDPQLFEENTGKLAKLNWMRKVKSQDGTSETVNDLWNGNILQSGGKISNTRQAILTAVANVKHLLRLTLTDGEQKALDEWLNSSQTQKVELEQITKS